MLKVFNFIRSYPDPKGWIEKQKAAYLKDSGLWFDILKEQISAYVKGALELTKNALEIANSTGPETYIPMLVSDIEKMEELEKLTDRELVKTAVKQWDHLNPLAKMLATRLEDSINRFQKLIVSVLVDKENPYGDHTRGEG